MKRLALNVLIVCLCLTAYAVPASISAPGAFDKVGMPISRHSQLEVNLLPSLSATQRTEIEEIYAKANREKSAILEEVIDLFRQEAADYPDLLTKPLNDDNAIYKAISKNEYLQFQGPRLRIYAEEAQTLTVKKNSRSGSASVVSVDAYRNQEQALADKLESSLDNAWVLVQPKLTQAQLQDLADLRGAWNGSKSPSPNGLLQAMLRPRAVASPTMRLSPSTSGSAIAAHPSRGVITPLENSEEAAYTKLLYRNIMRVWFPPKGNEYLQPRLRFVAARTGGIYNIQVTQSSGNAEADLCATKALQTAAPVRRVTSGVPDYVTFEMVFDCNGAAKLTPITRSSR